MTGNSSAARAAAVLAAMLLAATGTVNGDEPLLRLRVALVGSVPAPMTIELRRWSTDAERTPLLAALAAPPAPPPPAAAPAAGRGGRAAGRGGRGAAAPPLSPAARLAAAVRSAPTLGFIWGDGPTGYAIKYAWRSASSGGGERVVLVTDRRLGAHSPAWPPATGAAADAEFTLVEMRLDARGAGEAKTSHAAPVVLDGPANTLALDKYEAAPVLLKVTR